MSSSIIRRTAQICAAITTTSLFAGAALAERAPYYGEQIALRGVHGGYLVAEDDGTANANRANIGSWETFDLRDNLAGAPDAPLRFGDTIGLLGVHGTWVVAEDDGRLNADRANQGSWERFLVVDPTGQGGQVDCGSLVALRSVHGLYVVAENDGAANANRSALGPWEQWRVECLTPAPVDPGDVIGGDGMQAIEIAGADGLTLQFDNAQARIDGDDIALSGALALDFAGLRTELFEAELRVTLDAEGRIETLFGRARIAPDPVAALQMAEFDDLILGEIGLTYGRDLAHLPAPLQPETRYLFVHLEAGPSIGLGATGIAASGGATLVLDPTDPFIFVEGHIDGLSELTVLESAAIGVSAHGRIPLAATHDWGLDGITTEMQGHLYIAGRVAIPKTPVTVEGELLVDVDVDDDGETLFDGSPEAGLLFNGAADVDLEFGPLPGVTLPLASASLGGTIQGDRAGLWFSGESGLDASDLLPDLPFVMHSQRLVAGYVSTDIEDSFAMLGGDIQIGDWSLLDGSLYIDAHGATVDATLSLALATLAVQGRVDADGFRLTGRASFDQAIRAPRQLTEWVDVAVQYTANAAVCGYDTVTDGAVCGWDYVTDGAICGWDYVTDGARCGWDTFTGWFCGWSGLCSRREARSCDIARSCEIDATCEVAASCTRIEQRQQTRIVPDFDFGRVRGELSVTVENGAVSASANAEFCDVGGRCWGIDTGDLRVSPHDIELCVDVPELGHICLPM